MTKRFFGAVVAASLAAVAVGCGGGERAEREQPPDVPLNVNLVENPSFEQWDGPVPKGWQIVQFDGTGRKMNKYGKSTEEKSTGAFSFYLRGTYDVDRWMVLVQRHPVVPDHRLWFAAEMRARDIERNRGQESRANLYVRFYDADGNRVDDRYWADGWTRNLLGTASWRKIGKRVDVPKNAATVEIGCICQLTGWLYFDDVELVLEAPVPWRKVETKYVDFYYLDGYPFPDGDIERETEHVEMVLKKLDFEPEKENKINYYYYPSEEKFKEIKGFNIGRAHTRMSASSHELHTTRSFDDHQIIHLLIEQLGYPPFGLAEGIVFYCLGSWEGGLNIHMMAKELLISKRLPALYRILKQQTMEDMGMSTTIPGWASFSMWLIDRYGIDKFKKLYVETNEIDEPGPFNAHFKDIYGQDFDVMDREWRLWLLRYEPKI